MKLAIIAGGWHYPMHSYRAVSRLAPGADLFCVAHRKPEHAWDEKDAMVCPNTELGKIERRMYDVPVTRDALWWFDWQYEEHPNTAGDFTFFNQWLAGHDYRKYDVILNCHDDTYFRPGKNVFERADEIFRSPQPLLIANGRYPQAPAGYVRGSFEFWSRELLDMLGGTIPIPKLSLDRTGLTDSPSDFHALDDWNRIGVPMMEIMSQHQDRIVYLSQHYRVSEYVIEGERGLLSSNVGAPWSFEQGLKEFPIAEHQPIPAVRSR